MNSKKELLLDLISDRCHDLNDSAISCLMTPSDVEKDKTLIDELLKTIALLEFFFVSNVIDLDYSRVNELKKELEISIKEVVLVP